MQKAAALLVLLVASVPAFAQPSDPSESAKEGLRTLFAQAAGALQPAPGMARPDGVALMLSATQAFLGAAPSLVQVDLSAQMARAIDRQRTTRATSLLRRAD
jgi:hypothetical protein